MSSSNSTPTPNPPPPDLEVEVFRAGDYGAKGQYDEATLDRIAASYNPALHEAPVTLDHEQAGPAHGWVRRLRRVGDRLVATITRASEALMAALRSHAYKKRSIELYRRFAAAGDVPYIKAVSFLGAAVPEVKGLADPIFTEGSPAVVTFEEAAPVATPAPPPPPDRAAAARRHLMEVGRWQPRWEEAGLVRVFQALAGDHPAELDALVALFAEAAPAAPLGLMLEPPVPPPVLFAEDPAPAGATPESLRRHRAARDLQRADPALDYRTALLRIDPR